MASDGIASDGNPIDRALDAARRDARNVHHLVMEAERIFHAGEDDRAIGALLVAHEIAPDDYRVQRVLSSFLAHVGRQDEALAMAKSAHHLRPVDPDALVHLGGLLINCRDYRAAAALLHGYDGLSGTSGIGHHLYAVALWNLGRVNQAIAAEEKAIAVSPDQLEYRLSLASLLESRARYGDAISVMDEAKRLFPEDPRPYRTISGCKEALGDLGGSLADAEDAVRLAPGNSDYAHHRDNVRRQIGLLTETRTPQLIDAVVWSRPKRSQLAAQRSPRQILSSRWRVINALIMREMRTKHSRSALGYFWAIFEPISHLLTLGVMFAYVNTGSAPIGHSLFEFYCTGLLPYLMFAHIQTSVTQARSSAGALLLLPKVATTDVMFATTILNLMTEIVVGILVFAAFGAAGYHVIPENILVCTSAILLLALLGLGVGAINMVIQNFMHSWDAMFQMVIRLLYFASGIYYSPISMPDFVRRILELNPVLQGVELFRSGFYHDYHPFWLRVPFLVICTAVFLSIGLALEKTTRRLMRLHG